VTLTKQIKEGIVKRAVSSSFDSALEQAKKNLLDYYHLCLSKMNFMETEKCGDVIKKHLQPIRNIGVQNLKSCVWVKDPAWRFANVLNNRSYNNEEFRFCLKEDAQVINKDAEPIQNLLALINAKEEFEEATASLLAAVSTDKQLLAVCPELCAFLPEAAPGVSPDNALIPLSTINKVLRGLKGHK